MKRYVKTFRNEKKYLKKQSKALSRERLSFMDGTCLGDVDIFIESNATVRKVRRIMEKRICQDYWRTHKVSRGNGDRQRLRDRMTDYMTFIYGRVPEGFRYCA